MDRMRLAYSVWARVLVGARICEAHMPPIFDNMRDAYGQNAPRIFCVGPRVGRCTNMRGAYGYMRLLYLTICEAHMSICASSNSSACRWPHMLGAYCYMRLL